MKNKTVFFIKLILFIALLGFLLNGYARLVQYKESSFHKAPLLEASENVDVLLLGSSHMQDNIYPMTLWQDYGITSYNAGSSGEPVEITYYVLKELLKTVEPKIVVVDTYMVHSRKEGFDQNQGLVHGSIDFMKRDEVRLEAAQNMAKAQDMEPLSFMSDIYAYHTRWQELKKEDFEPEYSVEKGAIMLSGIYQHERHELPEMGYDEEKLDSVGFTYLSKIIELCREKDIKVVVTALPNTNKSEKKQLMADTCLKAAENMGAFSLDVARAADEIGIDYAHDFRDDEGHLNIIGSKKATDYLGSFLANELGAPDHRKDAAVFDKWKTDVSKWQDYKLLKAGNENNAVSMIMYAYNEPDFKVSVYGEESIIAKDEALKGLLGIMDIEPKAYDEMSADEKSMAAEAYGEEMDGLIVFLGKDAEDSRPLCRSFTFKESVFKLDEMN